MNGEVKKIAFWLSVAAAVAVAGWLYALAGCASPSVVATDGADVKTAAILADVRSEIAAVRADIGAIHVDGAGDISAALARFETTVDAAILRLSQTAGRDIVNSDRWLNYGLLATLAVIGGIYVYHNERRERQRNGCGEE